MHFPTHEQVIMKMVKNIKPIVIVNETLNNLDNTLFGIWPTTHGTTLFLNFLASKSWWRFDLRWVANESLRPCCSSFQINQRSGSQTQRSYCKTTTFSVNLTIGSVCVDEKHSACKIVLRKVDCKKNGGFNLCLSQLKEKKKKLALVENFEGNSTIRNYSSSKQTVKVREVFSGKCWFKQVKTWVLYYAWTRNHFSGGKNFRLQAKKRQI